MGVPNPFIGIHTPILWTSLIAEFGRDVDYLPDHDAGLVQTVTVIWKEGAEDEEISPGRYSNIWVQLADFTIPPRKGDGIQKDGKTYDVVGIDATAYGYSRLILQENNG